MKFLKQKIHRGIEYWLTGVKEGTKEKGVGVLKVSTVGNSGFDSAAEAWLGQKRLLGSISSTAKRRHTF